MSKRGYLLALVLITLGWGILGSGAVVAEAPVSADWNYQPTLLRPVWQGELVEGESVLFIRDAATGEASASGLFPITQVLSVTSSTGEKTYEEGRDYRWERDSRAIVLPVQLQT